MEVLSSARSTVLSDFKNLDKICSYESSQNDSVDFNFFRGKNIFTQINKKNGLEFLQIRTNNLTDVNEDIIDNEMKNERYGIHRLRKMKIENLYCVAPLIAYEIALGMSNGEIRILNYKSNEYISKFPAETSKHSVINLDYSLSDECLASVYENGSINIYGMKTKAKLETLNLDGNCTIAKFNSKKRFRLAIASYKGSVFLYDFQSHRKVFQAAEAHSAPCRDITMPSDHPDLLYSAGYDSVINIYDVKKKARVQQIKCRYPLSTISVSDCGTYCCAGNLKGELITYDLRLLKKPITERKIHESAVIRVAFVPLNSVKTHSSIFSSQIENDEINESNRISISNNENFLGKDFKNRDSFFDYIEFQNLQMSTRNPNVNSNRKQRESFDWDQLATVKRENEKRLSSNKMSLGLMKKKLTEDHSSSNLHLSEDFSLKNRNGNLDTPNVSEIKLMSYSKIIEETNEESEIFENQEIEEKNKYINPSNHQKHGIFSNECNKNTRCSTPNYLEKDHQNQQKENNNNDHKCGGSTENFSLNIEILKQIKELKLDIEKKFEYLENEIKFNAESNKWNLYSQNCNFWNKQNKVNNDICDALDILLHSDDFYQDYCRLKEENEKLKLTIEELKKKRSI